ncbi:MAG TPA: insulinase family protein [Anaeromyxobacteraceae bacterium]|nr:insulinase family protein [Anaeromyxobacteraceae bacterium]
MKARPTRRSVPLLAALVALAAAPARAGEAAAPPPPAAPPPAWTPAPPPPPAARAVPVAPPARELVLANGRRIVAVEHHARPLVLVTLVLPRGALSDPPDAAGATSLAIDIATDFHEVGPRGEELVEERSLRRQLAERGGLLRAGSGHDASWLSVDGFAGDLPVYLDLLATALREPRHGSQSYKGRRDARLDFLEDLRASDGAALEKVMAEAAFGPGHPYARPGIGTHAGLLRMGLEDVVRHQEALLVPEGATLLVVGDVSAGAALAQARTAFQSWKGRALPAPEAPPAPAARGGMGLLRRQPAATLVTCATRALGGVAASDAALELLAALLGEGPRSRLAIALRDEGGHAYSVGAALERRRHGRAFLACSPLAAGRAGEGLAAFRATLAAARAAPPTEADLAHARGLVLGRLDAGWDDAERISDAWSSALLLGEDRPRPERQRAALEAVTPAELWRVAREVLRPEALRWVVSGEPRVAEWAAKVNGLGAPVVLTLER